MSLSSDLYKRMLFCSCRKKWLAPGSQKYPVTMCAETTPGKAAFHNQYSCKEWLETQCIFFSFKARQFLLYCILFLMWKKGVESYFWRADMRFSENCDDEMNFRKDYLGLCRFNLVSLCPGFLLILCQYFTIFLIIFIWFITCIIPWSSIRHFLNSIF